MYNPRENTEWIETVNDGWNVLVGADYDMILESIDGFEDAHIQENVFQCGNLYNHIAKH
jgi:UDP-N-acetylglucosamine 2-epimerase (non-hydrolysing)